MKYITKSGDTFDSIVFELFNDIKYTKDLMDANKEYLSIVIFDGGINLNVPEIITTEEISNLLPWRR